MTKDTFPDLLRERSALTPDKRVYTFLADGEEVSATLTYGELDAQARSIAARLQEMGATGGRALLLYQPGLEFASAFLGCLYAGVTAIPAYPPHPTRLERTLPRLLSIVEDATPVAALTTSRLLTSFASSRPLPDPLERLGWIATDVAGADPSAWNRPPIGPDTLAFLQYTSGSTSDPKGVMVSQAHLLNNLRLISQAFAQDESAIVVGWLPFYHDMGLIGNLLQPLFCGGSCVLMPPLAFLQRPVRWLRAITRHQATTSGGPNFAYELCARKITPEQREGLDLRRWRSAFNGAEPIRAETLDRFAGAFSPYGFDRASFLPCYGLAEATLYVTGDEDTRRRPVSRSFDAQALGQHRVEEAAGPDARVLVGCGESPRDQSVVIVDPRTLRECATGSAGEIWVSGPSVAGGYWNRPELSAQTFGARLPDGRGPFLRTGDLGFLSDGQLFVTGREKDLIVIRGQNYYPQDIELSAERSHPAVVVSGCAAFSVDVGSEEQLVVLVEINRRHRSAASEAVAVPDIPAAVRRAIADEHQLQVWAVLCLDAGSIPKTSSGKVRRHLCRRLFQDGALEPLGEWRFPETAPATVASPLPDDAEVRNSTVKVQPIPSVAPDIPTIQAWLVTEVSARLGVPPAAIDIREPLASYGLDSKEAAHLSGGLEDWLGRRLAPTLAYEYPTIQKLASHLAGEPPTALPDGGPWRSMADESIAIIGIGCRFPGARDTAAFWALLRDGVDAISEVPPDRWAAAELYDPDRMAPGKVTTRWGGFLEGVDQFDPQFFGIAPREAARMDPQQRLVLEVAWAALEDAGQTREGTAGTRTGVFLGISTADYSRMQLADHDAIDAYVGTGSAFSIAANRLSYLMDWRGPSLAVDTACSSSLVAVHLACESLRNGESTLALAGGVNLILSPAITMNFSRAGVMAPDGRCKAFDAGANGYVRSEGVGIVILKPLARALADGDPIYAVIRGSAVGQDGRTNGLMAPSREAQEDVLRRAYRRAGVEPGQIDYVEAHGTGTFLGDPIEAAALGAVLAEGRDQGRHCAIGSVKANIGHTEAAAGIAGVIKVALSLHHGELPPSLHYTNPNPHIPFEDLPIRVQIALGHWPAGSTPPLAGVSSFGFGGANAHVVLEGAPGKVAAHPTEPDGSTYLLTVSGHNAEALRDMAAAYELSLASGALADTPLEDVCGAAAIRCNHHDHRLAIVARSREELIDCIGAFRTGESRPGMTTGRATARHHKVVFVFPGQGSQWPGMGRELHRRHPAFRVALEACDAAVRRQGGFSVIEALWRGGEESEQQDIDIVQPVLFAIEVALASLWRAWGIEPAAVVGHSMGEVAAAHIAGVLTLDDAARIICRRSRLLRSVSGRGAMAVVELTRGDAAHAIAGLEDRLSIAVSNSPQSTVLAGDPAALARVMASLESRDVFCSLVKVDVASHSPQMDPLRPDLIEALSGLSPSTAKIPILSTVTGQWLEGPDATSDYWARNLREPVLFSTAMTQLLDKGYDTFIEISPHPILLASIEEVSRHAGRSTAVALASSRRQDDSAIMASLGALHIVGHPIRWSGLLRAPAGRSVPLPPYAFQRQRHWFDNGQAGARAGGSITSGTSSASIILGPPRVSALHRDTFTWELTLSPRRPRYLSDHQVRGAVVVPATLYTDLAAQAAAKIAPDAQVELGQFEFIEMLALEREADTVCQVAVVRVDEETARFQFFSREAGEDPSGIWKLHARGNLRLHPQGAVPALVSGEAASAIRERCPGHLDGLRHYETLRARGLEYGPAFSLLESVSYGDGEALGRFRPASAPEAGGRLHPALVDAGLHAIAAASPDGGRHTYVPVGIESVLSYGSAEGPLSSHVRLRAGQDLTASSLTADVTFIEEDGRVVLEARGIRVQRVGEAGRERRDVSEWFYEVEWQPRPLTQIAGAQEGEGDTPRAGQPWLIFADRGGVGDALAAMLEARGENCSLVFAADDRPSLPSRGVVLPDPDTETIAGLIRKAGPGPAAYGGIVHLWALDFESLTPTLDELHTAQRVTCGSAWRIIQALASLDFLTPPRLWFVTSGAIAIGGQQEPVTLAQAPLWGLGNTAAHEHPELRCTRVDLSDAATPEEIEALVSELHAAEPDDRIALRDDLRYVARLARPAPVVRILRYAGSTRRVSVNGRYIERRTMALQERRSRARLEANATYLVTGGLGGLGLAVARWLGARGAGHVALMGRSAPSTEAETVLTAIREGGTGVTVFSGDIADRERTAAIIDAIDADLPPLRGIIHGAGVLDDGLLLHLDWARFRTTLAPKLDGAWNLHELTLGRPLDFFVLFSSVASVLGSPGQANYAAANAFLDALAYYRRSLGLPALSINWGPWEQVGLAATQPERARREAVLAGTSAEPADERPLLDRLALRGLESFSPEQGIEMLEQLMLRSGPQLAVIPVDWSQFSTFYPGFRSSPAFSLLHGLGPSAEAPVQGAAGRTAQDWLFDAPADQWQMLIEDRLLQQVARTMGLPPAAINRHQPLTAFGLDSLMAVELKNWVDVHLGVVVPVRRFLKGPSIAQFAVELRGAIAPRAAAATSAEHPC